MSKVRCSAVVLVLVVLAATSLSPLLSGEQQQVVDALQRQVVIERVPSRVVSLAPSITEILASLGLDNGIVGADGYSLGDWFMGVGEKLVKRGVVKVGEYWWSTVSVEKILELSPDLVLADKGAHRPLLDALEAYNLTVLFLNGGSANSVNDVYEDIYLVGRIFNNTVGAEYLIESIESALTRGREELKAFHGVKVIIAVDFWQGVWVAGRATYIDDILMKLGLLNAATTVGWSAVSVETIAKWNPDLIIVACTYATWDLVEQSGLTRLGKPIVMLNSTEVDVISRPGPLLARTPEVLYNALVKGFANTTTTTTPPPSKSTPAISDLTLLYLTIPLAAVLGVVVGYYLGLKRAKKP